ncbi:hypothetical protein [Limnobaculum xujianqingii]|uniref:hypothetical protein n=1 Tax=Limnobaculum xujianqingii TaxID=2738837 RepID=UPI0011285DE8|nr:hypothetical protein [Limnobaculum xujianqingii]
MAMKDWTLTPSDGWMRLSTGTETINIQVKYGAVEITESSSMPADNAPCQLRSDFTITPPLSIWARTYSQSAYIVGIAS